MGTVRVDNKPGIAVITIDNDRRRNAIDIELARRLAAAVEAASADLDVRAVVVTGAGSAFCAGADLAVLRSADEQKLRIIYESFLAVYRCPLPTVAAVNGPAVGAGMNLALSCDVRIASESAQFDPRFLRVPVHPGGGHLRLLQLAAGPQAAAAITLFGQPVSGRRAAEIGLAWQCVPDAQLIPAALDLCSGLVSAPPPLVRKVKQTLRATSRMALHEDAVEAELAAQLASMQEPAFTAAFASPA